MVCLESVDDLVLLDLRETREKMVFPVNQERKVNQVNQDRLESPVSPDLPVSEHPKEDVENLVLMVNLAHLEPQDLLEKLAHVV